MLLKLLFQNKRMYNSVLIENMCAEVHISLTVKKNFSFKKVVDKINTNALLIFSVCIYQFIEDGF